MLRSVLIVITAFVILREYTMSLILKHADSINHVNDVLIRSALNAPAVQVPVGSRNLIPISKMRFLISEN